MFAALETYSNVHRGSGHYSKATTRLYEKARHIVLDYLGLKSTTYTLLFLTPRRYAAMKEVLRPGSFAGLHSQDFGLHLGVSALAVRKKALPAGIPFDTGGCTTRLYDTDWVMWAGAPDKFEAGTPAIINIIGFAIALLLIKTYGKDTFREKSTQISGTRQFLQEDSLSKHYGSELLQRLQETLIGRDMLVPTTRGLKPYIHFDNSASTLCFEPVWDAFIQAYKQPAHIRQEIIDEVKQICAETMGAPLDGYEIIFTSNTTESVNIVARSHGIDPLTGTDQVIDKTSHYDESSHQYNIVENKPETIIEKPSFHKKGISDKTEPVILTTVLEHSSNDLPWRQLAGYTMVRLGVDNQGFFDFEELETLLRSYNKDHLYGRKRIRLLAMSGASNVLGSCNDLRAKGSLAKAYGAHLFVDAAQLAAHRKIDLIASGIDYLAFSAHKVYAPFGTGVLIARKGLLPLHHDERALLHTSALENAGGIAALGKALVLLSRIGFDQIEEAEQKLTNKALLAMSKIPGLKLHGVVPENMQTSMNRIGVITFEIGNKMPARIAARLVRNNGIGVRFGCHCAHLIIKQLSGFTPFTEKLQRFILRLVPMLNLQGITRASLGLQNTEGDVDVLVSELRRIAQGSGTRPGNDNKSVSETIKTEAISVPAKLVKQQIKEFIRSRERQVFGL
jgi:selenocysteine lyase/cysteine desulfurase